MLEEIRLGSNQIGDDGLGALQRVIESECLPYLTVVDVVGKSGNCASKEAVLDLTDALRLQQLRQIKQLKMLYEGKQLAARVSIEMRVLGAELEAMEASDASHPAASRSSLGRLRAVLRELWSRLSAGHGALFRRISGARPPVTQLTIAQESAPVTPQEALCA